MSTVSCIVSQLYCKSVPHLSSWCSSSSVLPTISPLYRPHDHPLHPPRSPSKQRGVAFREGSQSNWTNRHAYVYSNYKMGFRSTSHKAKAFRKQQKLDLCTLQPNVSQQSTCVCVFLNMAASTHFTTRTMSTTQYHTQCWPKLCSWPGVKEGELTLILLLILFT